MTSAGEISSTVLDQVRNFARAWASHHGEPSPRDIRVVSTTHRAAAKAIWGDAVDAPGHQIYLITLKGRFTIPGGPSGEWAALFAGEQQLSRRPPNVSLTLRPAEAIPDFRLENLGCAYTID